MFVRRLHSIEHDQDWSDFITFLDEQRKVAPDRHRKWATLPTRLIEQIESWLPQVNELITTSVPPVFAHADLHEDHIFGVLDDDDFLPTGVIDFGDSIFASPMYELPHCTSQRFTVTSSSSSGSLAQVECRSTSETHSPSLCYFLLTSCRRLKFRPTSVRWTALHPGSMTLSRRLITAFAL